MYFYVIQFDSSIICLRGTLPLPFSLTPPWWYMNHSMNFLTLHPHPIRHKLYLSLTLSVISICINTFLANFHFYEWGGMGKEIIIGCYMSVINIIWETKATVLQNAMIGLI